MASCEEKGVAFLKGNAPIGVRKNQPHVKTEPVSAQPAATVASAAPGAYNVALNGRNYRVVIDGKNALVNGSSYKVEVTEAAAEVKAAPATSDVGQPIITQLPGLVLRIEKQPGTPVKTGETIMVVESMKMENTMNSPVDGTVAEIHVKQGEQVQAGQVLAMIR